MLIRLGTVAGGRSSARVLTAVDATRHLPNCVCADSSEAGAEGVVLMRVRDLRWTVALSCLLVCRFCNP